LMMESYPPQFSLMLAGSLPTPCHQLRVVVQEPVENKINVEVYTLVDPNMMCTQVLKAFQVNIGIKTPQAGAYDVLLNGEKVGEIVWQ
ncbi:MAG TPA: hypothetical protein VFM46_13070, partial [Pseudomonadales bacterium]|nr:hypothetical protein [Pseudomonadales bacterium]